MDFAYEDHEAFPSLRVVNEDLKESEYKLGGRIQLCIVPAKDSGRKRRRKVWVTVVAGHDEMWTKDDDHFVQDEYIGKKDGDGKLIQFNPKNVMDHLPMAFGSSELTEEHIAKLRAWLDSDPMSSESDSESESDNESEQRQHWAEFFKSGQCDRSEPETVPAPEPSDAAEPEQQAPPEYIVPPQAPKLLRSRRRLPAGQPHQ